MDAALKQRLIGAAVLVALAVIFLPMLLGGPESTTPRDDVDVPVDIPPTPADTGGLQTREIAVALPPADAPAPAAVDDNHVATVDTGRAPATGDPVATAPAPTSAEPTAAEPAADEPTSAPTVAAAPAEQTPPATVQASESPATPPPTPATAAAATPPGHRFVVNLGSYANPDNARALAARLKQAGLPVLTESISVDGKPATRIRLGSYASQGEAEAGRLAARRLQSDLPATVVALADDDPAPAPRGPAIGQGYAVQLGALAERADADALRDRLRQAGFAAWTEQANTDSGTLWRVRAGPELTHERAETLRDAIRGKLALDGIVVGNP